MNLTVDQAIQQVIACHQNGQLQEAKTLCRSILESHPSHPVGWKAYGVILKQIGFLADSLIPMQRAVCLNPGDAHAHRNLGNTLRDLGRLSDAVASYREVVRLRPDYAEAHNDLGNALVDLGRLADAVASYREAICLTPDFAEAYSNLGRALRDLGRFPDAEACCRVAIGLKPALAEAHFNLGTLLIDFARITDAEASFREAIRLRPEFAEAHFNLGNTLRDLGRLSETEGSYREAVRHKPDYVDAYNNLGNTLRDLGRLSDAETCYREAFRAKPCYLTAQSNLLFCLRESVQDNAAVALQEARVFGEAVSRAVRCKYAKWYCDPHPQQLRIGFVSGDLRSHPIGHFIEAFMAKVDKSRVEIFCYPTNPTADDSLTMRLRSHAHTWLPLFGQSDSAAAAAIHSHGIHVLIDLSGHTSHNRLAVFAWKPAPIQASWLGFMATTGVAEIDYVLGDPFVSPPAIDHQFVETIWRFPEIYCCFTPPDTPVAVGPLPALRDGHITFCSFNNLPKMNDRVVTLWASVLDAVPDSLLFLKTKQLSDPKVQQQTRQRFAQHGITAKRLMLEGFSPRKELLKAYNRADIALDPFPYTGGTTNYESLWMGVPFVTLEGHSMLSRAGQSIAANAGLEEWIARDEDDYIQIAKRKAEDLDGLAESRRHLRDQVLQSPLFDSKRFARRFEESMWAMWGRWLVARKQEANMTQQ